MVLNEYLFQYEGKTLKYDIKGYIFCQINGFNVVRINQMGLILGVMFNSQLLFYVAILYSKKNIYNTE